MSVRSRLHWSQPTHDNWSKFGLIGSYVMIWWCGQSIMGIRVSTRERDWEWDEPGQRERWEWEWDCERSWEFWIVAIRCLSTCAITNCVHAPKFWLTTIPLYHYTTYTTIPLYHYTTTYPHPLPKSRPAIILHRSSDNIFNNLCTTVFHPRPR